MRNLLTKKLLLMSFGFVRRVAGYPVKLLKSLGKPLKQYKIYGNSIQQSVNLYNVDSTQITSGYYLNANGAEIVSSSGYWSITDYIDVNGYDFVLKNVGGISPAVCLYDTDKKFIKGVAYGTTGTQDLTDIIINSKILVKYVRFSIFADWDKNNIKLEYMPSPTTPIEIENVGEKTVNLIDYNNLSSTIDKGITYTNNNDGSFTANGTLIGVLSAYIFNVPSLEKGVAYYTSCGQDLDEKNRRYYLFLIIKNTSTNKVRYHSSNAVNKTFTLAEDEEVTSLQIRINDPTASSISIENLVFKPILCKNQEYQGYEPYGYKIPITVSGKNLFNINKVTTFVANDYTTKRATYSSISDNIITSKLGSYVGLALLYDSKITLPAGTYTISADFMAVKESGNKGITIGGYGVTNDVRKYGFKTLSNYKVWERQYYTFTLDTQTELAIEVQGTGQKDDYTNLNIKIKNIQLEKNDNATQYEPYQEPKTTNIYLKEPLRRIGDYADYIDFENKKVVRNVKSELMYNENWLYVEDKDIIYFAKNNIKSSSSAFCTCLPDEIHKGSTGAYVRPVSGVFRIYNRGYWESLDIFKTWISEHQDYKVEYLLITPTEETIELPEIKTVKNTAIITTDTNIPAWCISCEYLSKTKDNNTAYLKSSKTQYIDIEFKPNQDTAVEAKCLSTSTDTQFLWGARDSDLNNTFTTLFSTSNHARFDYNTTRGSYVNFTPTLNKAYVYYQNKNKGIIDNVLFKTWTYTNFQANYNLYLFTVNQANSSNPSMFVGNIYNCKVWDNDVLIRDMIPVTDYQGTPSMWDFETEKYYYNKGTGTDFIFGNEEE